MLDMSNNANGYVSQFKFYSIGFVTANKEARTDLIDVQPVELIWASNGEVINNYSEETINSINNDGHEVEHKVISSNNLTATWLPLGESVRISPPDVRRGHYVMLLSDADENYYWMSIGLYMERFRLGTVLFGVCANPDVKTDRPVSAEYWYLFEICTVTGHITVTTSIANNEYTTYSLTLDTMNGFLQFIDGINNEVLVNSKENQLLLRNGNGSFFELFKDDININAVGNMSVTVGGNYTKTVKGNLTTNVTGNMTATANKFDYTADTTYTISCINYALNSGSYALSAATGTGTASGGMTVVGKMAATNIEATAGITAGGDITASGEVHGSNI